MIGEMDYMGLSRAAQANKELILSDERTQDTVY